jgi:hypothetical protein
MNRTVRNHRLITSRTVLAMSAVAPLLACGDKFEFSGTPLTPKNDHARIVTSLPPDYHIVGRIKMTPATYSLDVAIDHLSGHAATYGCDVVVCNTDHQLVVGVASDETTGVKYNHSTEPTTIEQVIGDCAMANTTAR